jgi:hypothetical protein
MQPEEAELVPDYSAWLSTAKSLDPVCFQEGFLIRLQRGGYIARQEENVFRFPIERLTLPGGEKTALTLSIPFEGTVSLPKTNYGRSGGSTHSYVPLYLSVVGIEQKESELVVLLWSEGKGTAALTFSLLQ